MHINENMPTYIYETIPESSEEPAVRFELQQSMSESPLKVHPETGQAVRRVISGGFGHIRKGEFTPHVPCGNDCRCH